MAGRAKKHLRRAQRVKQSLSPGKKMYAPKMEHGFISPPLLLLELRKITEAMIHYPERKQRKQRCF